MYVLHSLKSTDYMLTFDQGGAFMSGCVYSIVGLAILCANYVAVQSGFRPVV